MLFHEISISVPKLVLLFAVLFVLGTLVTLPLYKFKWRELVRSRLFVKILFWVPIFTIFLLYLHLGGAVQLLLLLALCAMALRELLKRIRGHGDKGFFLNYYLLFAVALLHFHLIGTAYGQEAAGIIAMICFASVLADVCAFFFGKYFGRHHLPDALNKNKSWEGVGGQVVGALAGVLLVHWLIWPAPSLWMFAPIAAGTVLGDLGNSFAKRRLKIDEWSNGIPGHGGYLDRLASLAGSALLTYYYLMLTAL
jgi:phosphatidate cytidylyltransferase